MPNLKKTIPPSLVDALLVISLKKLNIIIKYEDPLHSAPLWTCWFTYQKGQIRVHNREILLLWRCTDEKKSYKNFERFKSLNRVKIEMFFGADFSRCQNNFADVFVLCKLMDEMLGFFFLHQYIFATTVKKVNKSRHVDVIFIRSKNRKSA